MQLKNQILRNIIVDRGLRDFGKVASFSNLKDKDGKELQIMENIRQHLHM